MMSKEKQEKMFVAICEMMEVVEDDLKVDCYIDDPFTYADGLLHYTNCNSSTIYNKIAMRAILETMKFEHFHQWSWEVTIPTTKEAFNHYKDAEKSAKKKNQLNWFYITMMEIQLQYLIRMATTGK